MYIQISSAAMFIHVAEALYAMNIISGIELHQKFWHQNLVTTLLTSTHSWLSLANLFRGTGK